MVGSKLHSRFIKTSSIPLLLRRYLNISSVLQSSSFSSPSSTSSSPLLDNFNRFHNYLRVSITEKCNLRCVYCMPPQGINLTPNDQLLTLSDRQRLISLFARHGVNKIRFTGGEPTINKTLSSLIRHCHDLQTFHSIGITTNGLVLKSQLSELINAGLTHINISLDTLQPEKYEKISRRDRKGLAMILSSLYAAIAHRQKQEQEISSSMSGEIGSNEKRIKKPLAIKVNCVLMRQTNYSEIIDFIEFSQQTDVDFRFIEVMPFDDNHWDSTQLVPYFEVLDYLATQGYPLEKITEKDPHDTTKWYRLKNKKSGAENSSGGRIGFITSMSSHFCGGCNRLRITADGKLKVCLFGNEEVNLLEAIREGRSDEELIQIISTGVKQKKESLGGHDTPASIAATENRPMILIGG